MTENEKLRALLAEARETLLGQHDPEDNIEMVQRIDAALAEPVEIDDTVIATWTREQYERAYQRGAEAMREAAAAEAQDRVNNLDHGEIEDAILALPVPTAPRPLPG